MASQITGRAQAICLPVAISRRGRCRQHFQEEISPNARVVGVGREGFLREIADSGGLITGGLTRQGLMPVESKPYRSSFQS